MIFNHAFYSHSAIAISNIYSKQASIPLEIAEKCEKIRNILAHESDILICLYIVSAFMTELCSLC